tara:strand:- start:184 stop:453 length:270 start_codon:yes stop_codon:yes gene_type:complete
VTKDKLDVTIEYCHTCGDDLRAAWIAGEVLLHHGDYINNLKLLPSGHGKFNIYFNDEVVLEHTHNPHHWPEAREVTEKLREWKDRRSIG